MKKKYQIKEHGNGIFEVSMSIWVWSNKSRLLQALQEISVNNIVLYVRSFTDNLWRIDYLVFTMPKQK